MTRFPRLRAYLADIFASAGGRTPSHGYDWPSNGRVSVWLEGPPPATPDDGEASEPIAPPVALAPRSGPDTRLEHLLYCARTVEIERQHCNVETWTMLKTWALDDLRDAVLAYGEPDED